MKRFAKGSMMLVCALAFVLCGSLICAAETGISRVSCCVFGNLGRGFCWFTSEDCGSDLELIETERFSGSFESAVRYCGTSSRYRGLYSHHAVAKDLKAGTAYTYRVGDRSRDLWSKPGSFATDDGDERFSFIAIADVQSSDDEGFQIGANTLKAALDLFPETEFTVNLGDYVNDNTNEEWDLYFSRFAFANDRLTHVPVAGNHDGNITNKLNTNCFKTMFCLDESSNRSLEGVYYSFDWGSAHFAVLNTNDMYPMSRAQRSWLENDMTNTGAKWKIVLMHRALYSAGKNINKPDTIAMRNELLPLFDKLQIDLALAGHDHMYLRTAPVRGDQKVPVTFTPESFDGETLSFAKDPAGTVYALPSTAGAKRYALNERAMPPILDVADTAFSTRELGGCFASVAFDGDKLVYRAYAVDDTTKETSEIDSYALLKTESSTPKPAETSDSVLLDVLAYPFDFLIALVDLIKSYLVLLFSIL